MKQMADGTIEEDFWDHARFNDTKNTTMKSSS